VNNGGIFLLDGLSPGSSMWYSPAMPTTITEADILEQLVAPSEANLPPDLARALLRFRFNAATTRTIRRLLRQNNQGVITAEDRVLLEKYLRVGQMVDLMHAKARLSMKKSREDP
jgi:hypothetical protein